MKSYKMKPTHLQIVDELLKNSKQYKINVVSLNNNGKDGQALAEQEGHTDVVKLIQDWKKKQSNEVPSHIQLIHDEILFQLEGSQHSGDPRILSAISLIKEIKENTN